MAGIGSSSMITGSPAVTVRLWIRASGVRPCAFSAASLTTSTPLAPSQIWLALAALIRPPSLSSLTDADALRASRRSGCPRRLSWRRGRAVLGGHRRAARSRRRRRRPRSRAAALRWLSSAKRVELLAAEPIFLGDHLGADELAEHRRRRTAPGCASGTDRCRCPACIASVTGRPIGTRVMLRRRRRSPRPGCRSSPPGRRTGSPAARSRTGGRW